MHSFQTKNIKKFGKYKSIATSSCNCCSIYVFDGTHQIFDQVNTSRSNVNLQPQWIVGNILVNAGHGFVNAICSHLLFWYFVSKEHVIPRCVLQAVL